MILGEQLILFLTGPPDLSDPRFVSALGELFAVNRRNTVLLVVYFVLLLALAVGTLYWLTRGFSHWRLAPLGIGIVAVFGAVALLPLWRLVAEEGPHLRYGRTPEAFAQLRVVRGTVTSHGSPVSLGRPLPMRKVGWRLDQPPAQGVTPYLPERIVRDAPPGTPVWLGVDPTGTQPPLFLGFGR